MSLIERKDHSQVVPSSFDDQAFGQLKGLLGALSLSQRSVVADGERTASDFRCFMAAMQAQFAALSEENLSLREQVVAQGSREREMIVLHHGELAAVRQDAETARREVIALRQEMIESAQRAEARVSAEIAAKTEAVRAATQAGDARLAASQQETASARQEIETMRQEHAQRMTAAMAEKNAAVQATTQRGDAQMAAALQQAEAIRQAEAERARKGAAETRLQAVDTTKMLECFQEIQSNETLDINDHNCTLCGGICTVCRNFSDGVQALRLLIDERARRTIDLNTNGAQQRIDTQKLQQVLSGLISVADHHLPSTWAILAPQRQVALQPQVKLSALIAERNTR